MNFFNNLNSGFIRNYIMMALILMFLILGLSEIFMTPIPIGQKNRLEGYGQAFRAGFVHILSNWR